MRRGNQGKAFPASPSSSIPNPPRHLASSLHLGIGRWRSWLWVRGSGIEWQGWHEKGFGGGDDEDGDDDEDEDDGGDNGCCSFCLEMGDFHGWLVGRWSNHRWWESLCHHHGPFFQLDFFQGLDSFTFFWIFMNQNQIIIHFFKDCVVLCCVVAAQISGGVALSWPRSVVVFCFCEAQISGSHTSLYLTITLFLSLRLIWKFLA